MTLQEVWSLLNLYKSAFSGEQIDEAIGLILNGGISAAVEAAQQSADAAAKSASDAAGSAAESGSAETNAQNAAAQAAESADQAKRYAEQAHAIAGENLVFSVNGVQADETGNVQIPTGGVKTINGETPDDDGDITLDAGKVKAISANAKGKPNGVAELDDEGKVPAAQLPATMTPAAHAETHKRGGSDPLTAADIGAATAETGTWTPVFDAGSVFTADQASYNKVGKTVIVTARIFMNQSDATKITFTGLPYTPSYMSVGHFYAVYNHTAPSFVVGHVHAHPNGTCSLLKEGVAYANMYVLPSEIGARNFVILHLMYETNS